MQPSSDSPAPDQRARLIELARLFLRLGTTAFGGPAAHIAMMEEEVVRSRKWLTREELLDLVGATNLIPGPNSTELAIHIGHRRAGFAGLVVAGTCFILPAALITLGFAWAYVRFGALPQANGVLYGIKPVIIGVVLQAIWGLTKSAAKSKALIALGLVATAGALAGAPELAVLFAAGFVAVFFPAPPAPPAPQPTPVEPPPPTAGASAMVTTAASASAGVTAGAATGASSWSIFLVFAKIGSVLFGSGYVLLAFLRAELVEQRHWLTEAQLVDAVAVGQLTPGPVFTTATFVGYLMGGTAGAGAATIGIFLPAFVFVALSRFLVPMLRRSRRAGAFLDGVNVASLALMAVVTLRLARSTLIDVPTVVLAAVSLALLVRWKVSSFWLILGGAALGTLATLLR
ncbi:MAG TPA: chromate efflux transporter [Polyangiaceae bacterium]|nr:chromate efflux transporter [Polyangiaceae bacterium]